MARLRLISIIVLYILASASSQIPSLVPEAYWGTAFIDGNPAAAGSNITVEVYNTGKIVGTGTVGNSGLYSVDVIFDNELTVEGKGAKEGDKLTWRINGIPTSIPAPGEDIANSGGVNSNFNIFTNSAKRNISPELVALIIVILLLAAILLILLKKRANGTS